MDGCYFMHILEGLNEGWEQEWSDCGAIYLNAAESNFGLHRSASYIGIPIGTTLTPINNIKTQRSRILSLLGKTNLC